MKSIAFHIQKGGTGKSGCGGNVAAGLACMGCKTILVDCDQQGNSSSWFLTAPIDSDLADALNGDVSFDKAVIEIGVNFSFCRVAPPGRSCCIACEGAWVTDRVRNASFRKKRL
jgi:MinD-like ATPase involved in chromosome partitioning or flagellar assembly